MQWLTQDSALACDHGGRVALAAGQHWLTIAAVPALVAGDPERRPVTGCPNTGPTIKPCTATLAPETGPSDLIRVDGRPAVLSHLRGKTDGTPPGLVTYTVQDARQPLVGAGR